MHEAGDNIVFDSFHPPRAGGNGSIVSCIFDYQIVLERASEDPHARRIGPFARSLSEQGYTRGLDASAGSMRLVAWSRTSWNHTHSSGSDDDHEGESSS